MKSIGGELKPIVITTVVAHLIAALVVVFVSSMSAEPNLTPTQLNVYGQTLTLSLAALGGWGLVKANKRIIPQVLMTALPLPALIHALMTGPLRTTISYLVLAFALAAAILLRQRNWLQSMRPESDPQ